MSLCARASACLSPSMFTSSSKMKKAHRLPLRFEDKETMSFEAYRGTTLFDSMPRIQLCDAQPCCANLLTKVNRNVLRNWCPSFSQSTPGRVQRFIGLRRTYPQLSLPMPIFYCSRSLCFLLPEIYSYNIRADLDFVNIKSTAKK